jgi:hypothetical protein
VSGCEKCLGNLRSEELYIVVPDLPGIADGLADGAHTRKRIEHDTRLGDRNYFADNRCQRAFRPHVCNTNAHSTFPTSLYSVALEIEYASSVRATLKTIF